MDFFNKVKEIVDLNISDDLLKALVFEMSRYFDKNFTNEIKLVQKRENVIIDTPNRKILRKKFYYGKLYDISSMYDISSISYTESDVEKAFEDSFNRLQTYDFDKIVKSMKRRIKDLDNHVETDYNMDNWLKYYNEKRLNKLYSFVSIKLDQKIFEKNNFNENILIDFIRKTYEGLENYRHLALVVEGEIFNKNEECITWNLLYKAGIYAENFIQFKEKFLPFHKDTQIENLKEFLNKKNIDNSEQLASDFYKYISTGYKYEDCYISNNQSVKILIYRKIELDNSPVPCPSCNTIIQNGNSYPEMFLRSWECKNPSCPDRSKSGRGKRFDEYGVYRYFKLVEKDKDNIISSDLYQKFRRDIFDNEKDYIEFLIKEYTFSKESIFMLNENIKHSYNRKIVSYDINTLDIVENSLENYNELPLVEFFKNVSKNLHMFTGKDIIKNKIEIINGNSSEMLQGLAPGQIGAAITSPPYYNAREYSQWGTLIMYYVDMLINCKAVYNALADGAYYLYNIGDIVSEDNIYVKSNMSKHRVQLGFLSSAIFEIAGYNLTGNIIWDKGEVQSKRNSTINLISGYVKCINCYEHVLVFRKGKFEFLSNRIEKINPVIKINCNGINTYKHTAPYPLEIVDLIRPYASRDLFILDPYLGSGTTLKWCSENNFNGIGYELNSEYFELCKENVLIENGEH